MDAVTLARRSLNQSCFVPFIVLIVGFVHRSLSYDMLSFVYRLSLLSFKRWFNILFNSVYYPLSTRLILPYADLELPTAKSFPHVAKLMPKSFPGILCMCSFKRFEINGHRFCEHFGVQTHFIFSKHTMVCRYES